MNRFPVLCQIVLACVCLVGVSCWAMPQPIRPRVPVAPSTMTLISPNGRHTIELVASDQAAFVRISDRQTAKFSIVTSGPGQPYIAVSDTSRPYPDVVLIDEGIMNQRAGEAFGVGPKDMPARAPIGAVEGTNQK